MSLNAVTTKPIRLVLEPQVLFFDPEQLARWTSGDRADCSDAYCRKMNGSSGFGEYLVGAHFEERGYEWVHHDFDVFGTNRPGKYPRSEAVLSKRFGEERLAAARELCRALGPFREEGHAPLETPDLMIFKPDGSEVRFTECKRTDTRDRLNPRQAVGLALIAAFLRCPVELFVVAPRGSSPSTAPIEIELPPVS